MTLHEERGLTLIELLSAILISIIIFSILSYFLTMIIQAFQTTLPRNLMNSSIATAQQALVNEFQNLKPTTLTVTNNTLIAQDVNNNTVDIFEQGQAIIIQTTIATTHQTQDQTITSPTITFSGTTFATTDHSTATIMIKVTSLSKPSLPSQSMTSTLVAGGGLG